MNIHTLESISKSVFQVISELSSSNIVITPLIYQKIFFEVCENFGVDKVQINGSLISEDLIEDSMLNFKEIVLNTQANCTKLKDITDETFEALKNRDSDKIGSLKRKVEILQGELLKLERKLYQDKLTLAFNKQWIIERKLDDKLKFKDKGIMVIINLDKFSRVNDKYGYDIGNKVLKFVSNEFLKSLSEVVRFEGDEFLIFFDKHSIESVKNFLNRFRNHISSKYFNSKGRVFTVSFSFGVCQFEKGELFQNKLDVVDDLMKNDKSRKEREL